MEKKKEHQFLLSKTISMLQPFLCPYTDYQNCGGACKETAYKITNDRTGTVYQVCLEGTVHPKVKIQSLSPHLHADGK